MLDPKPCQMANPTETLPEIGDYAAIGDSRICALVSRTGSIDWLCLPHVGGPSVFAALLDPNHGGRFRISPPEWTSVERHYVPETNVLETVFVTPQGRLRITDLVPIPHRQGADAGFEPDREILRVVEALSGEPEVEMHVAQPCSEIVLDSAGSATRGNRL
jgi:GH15 family glucan-1,4-alpha-glucosidase